MLYPKIKLLTLSLALFLISSSAMAGSQWYRGVVDRVSISGDGEFVVTFESDALSDCMHGYAYFNQGSLGEFKFKTAYTIALTSLTTGRSMGVVINKDINGPGGKCYATGMIADIR